jgi:hypothetical protein
MPQSPALIPFIQAAIRDEYRQAGVHQVIEVPPEIEKVLEAHEIFDEPQMRPARESAIKEKPKAEQKAEKITKQQVNQIYMLVADLALESTVLPKAMKEIGFSGKLADLPATLFGPLAENLQKRANK